MNRRITILNCNRLLKWVRNKYLLFFIIEVWGWLLQWNSRLSWLIIPSWNSFHPSVWEPISGFSNLFLSVSQHFLYFTMQAIILHTNVISIPLAVSRIVLHLKNSYRTFTSGQFGVERTGFPPPLPPRDNATCNNGFQDNNIRNEDSNPWETENKWGQHCDCFSLLLWELPGCSTGNGN